MGKTSEQDVIHAVRGHVENAEAFGGVLRSHYLR